MAKIDVKSDITGLVFKVLVKPGDTVKEGDTVVILESMKMEIQVTTMDSGVVAEVTVREGQTVEEGETIAVLEA